MLSTTRNQQNQERSAVTSALRGTVLVGSLALATFAFDNASKAHERHIFVLPAPVIVVPPTPVIPVAPAPGPAPYHCITAPPGVSMPPTMAMPPGMQTPSGYYGTLTPPPGPAPPSGPYAPCPPGQMAVPNGAPPGYPNAQATWPATNPARSTSDFGTLRPYVLKDAIRDCKTGHGNVKNIVMPKEDRPGVVTCGDGKRDTFEAPK